jgi:3-oxoacyl-[acyl-carrier-protein] synthase-3
VSLYLHGMGHFHPENEITNRFLEELDIGTDEQWILDRVGIRSRRTVLPLDYIRDTRNRDTRQAMEVALYTHADTGVLAAEMALERAGITRDAIGMVIAGSSRPGLSTPADACHIANALGMEVPAFDMNSACTSMWVALYMLSNMRPEGLPDYVLVVAPESLTTTVDYDDRSASVLWSDCTAAAIVSARVPSRIRMLDHTLESSPAGYDKVIVPLFGHFTQEGRTVQMFAIKKTVRCLRRIQETYPGPGRTLNFVGHQANLRMLESVCQACDIDEERHHSNVVEYGNGGAAGAPSVLSMNWDGWTEQDDVAVVGVGSGLTWASFVLRFGDQP